MVNYQPIRTSRSEASMIGQNLKLWFFKSQKNYCFAIKDELNTDVRCDFYLPGNLYRIEIITDGPRDAKAEISEVPSGWASNASRIFLACWLQKWCWWQFLVTRHQHRCTTLADFYPTKVRLLHGAKKTRHIKLSQPINRPENGFQETGTDIFLKPGKRLNGIDGILLTNTKDPKIISNWKIGKISAYLCRKLKADASGADQGGFHSNVWLNYQTSILIDMLKKYWFNENQWKFHWENGIYWNDIALNDNMVNLRMVFQLKLMSHYLWLIKYEPYFVNSWKHTKVI